MLKSTETSLVAPFGGTLVDLMVPEGQAETLRAEANQLPSIQISERVACDLELMAVGGFSPLDRFMSKDDYQSVLDNMRLTNGTLFPIPVTLPIGDDVTVSQGQKIALRDSRNDLLAVMDVEEIYEWDLDEASNKVFGTTDVRHPLVAEMHRWGGRNLSGKITVLQLPGHPDYRDLRHTPAQTRAALEKTGRANVVAFQTRNPLHRVHEELTKRAADQVDGVLLLHPVVGLTRPGDVDHFTRVRTYQALTERYYDSDRILLSLLPLAMRMGGPREALWHAIIRRNFGANHIIIGRDHAGPGVDSKGEPFYGPYDAQEAMEKHADELGVGMVPFTELVYLPDKDRYEQVSDLEKGANTASISGTQVREEFLNVGKQLPSWFTRPEVAEILSEQYPPKTRQGACIWFTGLSGSGKTTTAEMLVVQLMEQGRQVTVLDGDVVRTHLSKGLGFSAEDRDTNIRRIGYVASEIVRHGGIVICAAISPYRATRDDVRNMVGSDQFIEVFVDTPLDVCESRDAKGMYAKARRGEITGFTGIDDPYEEPLNPEVTLDTVGNDVEANSAIIVEHLAGLGFVRSYRSNGNGHRGS
ncbi:MAG: bifunctional sulfate adenylyltransferase/adenylylsulfate kinase [SAR202 cluster bacterium]|nr:bifunctional sulfate adenylyltransferase/adenylylsulfate kinase [SAR202 cluster bacterium]MDP7104952.1 bifunctional sulfate adenylyltransferase/adenylylsulfate kinase [SAR202 cluster bacterium]MDP7225252.1 bifunctional sulfate adenylyltransferase/adenylylsulfate kinase [SAR202 cluster bacterium]MDP7414662.1 bifunctional sulfate adenylyltransferase/adenylylsulfate kinase [SAR202 cluster bacterium]HJO82633.1 bifunctional sulfate adenylyltransferase/adenylylsulfate kinase [SAR202 cluster bacter